MPDRRPTPAEPSPPGGSPGLSVSGGDTRRAGGNAPSPEPEQSEGDQALGNTQRGANETPPNGLGALRETDPMGVAAPGGPGPIRPVAEFLGLAGALVETDPRYARMMAAAAAADAKAGSTPRPVDRRQPARDADTLPEAPRIDAPEDGHTKELPGPLPRPGMYTPSGIFHLAEEERAKAPAREGPKEPSPEMQAMLALIKERAAAANVRKNPSGASSNIAGDECYTGVIPQEVLDEVARDEEPARGAAQARRPKTQIGLGPAPIDPHATPAATSSPVDAPAAEGDQAGEPNDEDQPTGVVPTDVALAVLDATDADVGKSAEPSTGETSSDASPADERPADGGPAADDASRRPVVRGTGLLALSFANDPPVPVDAPPREDSPREESPSSSSPPSVWAREARGPAALDDAVLPSRSLAPAAEPAKLPRPDDIAGRPWLSGHRVTALVAVVGAMAALLLLYWVLEDGRGDESSRTPAVPATLRAEPSSIAAPDPLPEPAPDVRPPAPPETATSVEPIPPPSNDVEPPSSTEPMPPPTPSTSTQPRPAPIPVPPKASAPPPVPPPAPSKSSDLVVRPKEPSP